MDLIFDISEDELPIFQAEADEHLQNLEEGLVRLEREERSPELLQSIFRAAHTLKGSSGMIGHKRMVELTHALETALDGVRKGNLEISAELIDVCLNSIDSLRGLIDEVLSRKTSDVEIGPLIERLSIFTSKRQPSNSPNGVSATPSQTKNPQKEGSILIKATISPDSIASAPRAFQLMLTLQGMGQIIHMEPSQEQIETATPVTNFSAQLIPSKSLNEVRQALASISEIESLTIGESEIIAPANDQSLAQPTPQINKKIQPLGESLVSKGLITQDQLNASLQKQNDEGGPAAPLGQFLVGMGFISQEILDEVISEQNQAKVSKTAAESEAVEKARGRGGEKTVRTSVERLDQLMNLVGELITDRNRIYQIRRDFEERYRGDQHVESLSDTVIHIGRITDMLQAEVMGIRMLPISNVFNKFPRLVRDLSQKAGKQIDLVMRGEDTELDRSVIEVVSDPLIHLLRNSVDHGIESPGERRAAGKPERGVILLTARHEQGRIILTVEDNGRGIDIERVKNKAIERGTITKAEADAMTMEEGIDLIFQSGLSTAKKVSDVSGRGVGMDIVKNNIERLNGTILVETWPGRGTQFQLVLPLTLAIVPTLLVKIEDVVYAIPLVTVTETLRIKHNDIHTVNSRPVIRLRDHVLPVIKLADVFDIKCKERQQNIDQHFFVVVVRSGKIQLGIIVDRLVGEQEVVVKSLSSLVGEITGVSSAAILGDGSVTLIIDVQGLFKLAAIH